LSDVGLRIFATYLLKYVHCHQTINDYTALN